MVKQVSIVVPLRNDERYISKCLDSIKDQTYPQDKLEIIVVDGKSEDNSADIVRRYAQSRPIKLLENPRKITPVARNIGVREATGEYVAIIDSHNFVEPDYIEKGVGILESRSDIDCVGGRRTNIGSGYIGGAIAAVLGSPFGVGDSKHRTGNSEQLVDTVALPIYRRAVFTKVGLFDERLVRNQDNDFNFRLRGQGGGILLAPQMVAYYFVPNNLTGFCRQAFKYGFWNIRMVRIVGGGLSARHFAPLAFVLALIAAAFLFLFGDYRLLLLLGLAYFTPAIFFGVIAGQKSGRRFIPALPLLFLLLHLTYGVGSLYSVIETFIRRKRDLVDQTEQAALRG